jgi:hypothetical protein
MSTPTSAAVSSPEVDPIEAEWSANVQALYDQTGPQYADPATVDSRCSLPDIFDIYALGDPTREWPDPFNWPEAVARVFAFNRAESQGPLAPAGDRYVIAFLNDGEISLFGEAPDGLGGDFPSAVVWTDDEMAAGQRAADIATRCVQEV